jgi:hypothetical protein
MTKRKDQWPDVPDEEYLEGMLRAHVELYGYDEPENYLEGDDYDEATDD